MLFFVARGVFGKIGANLAQRDFLQDFVNGSSRLQETLEVNQFLHIGVEVCLLLNRVGDLHKELFVNQRLDAANGEVRHEVLTVAEIAQVIESVQKVVFEVEQGFGLVGHAEPKHSWYAVAAEKPQAVEVHRERLVLFGHLLASFDDVRNIINRCAAQELQCQMDVFGSAIVDEFLVRRVLFQSPDESRKLRPRRDG